MKIVGIYEIEDLLHGKWQFTNTLTGIAHRTFGTTWEEIEGIAKRQSDLWEKRFADKKQKGTLLKGQFHHIPGTTKKVAAKPAKVAK